jgi:dipeptidyl aminopeptidase/acylaminoacyl peptidase
MVSTFGFIFPVGLVLAAMLSSCGVLGKSDALVAAEKVTLQTPTVMASPSSTSTPRAESNSVLTPTLTITATITNVPTPTSVPTPTITPTPTPHPLAGYTIKGLRERNYPYGLIEITHTITETDSFNKYLIRYPSDDLFITGMMNVPQGEGPFPVVILNHGYIPPSRYWSGADTWRAADHLAAEGYITISPDFRGWGGSDSGENYFRTGLVVDVLHLISSLPSLPQADPERVGMWGHSMGGGVTTKAITIDPRIKAAVLYAPVSGDDTDVIRRWGPGGGGGTESSLTRAYRDASTDRDFLRLTSPIHHFELVIAPVQIHQGTADATTPPSWAEALRDALQAAGKYVEYFSYRGQGHAFDGDSWDLFMQRVLEFFDDNLAGGHEAE